MGTSGILRSSGLQTEPRTAQIWSEADILSTPLAASGTALPRLFSANSPNASAWKISAMPALPQGALMSSQMLPRAMALPRTSATLRLPTDGRAGFPGQKRCRRCTISASGRTRPALAPSTLPDVKKVTKVTSPAVFRREALSSLPHPGETDDVKERNTRLTNQIGDKSQG